MKSKKTNINITSGENLPFWLDSVQMPSTLKLEGNLETEILIVGGGIAGLTTAYFLLKRGKKIALVEDGQIASGETGRTTAHLTAALDDRYYFLEDTFGGTGAKLAAESHTSAIAAIEQIVRAEKIDCDFLRVSGYLFLHPSDKPSNLEKEFSATQRAGLKTHFLEKTPGMDDEMNCIEFCGQAQFHIGKYMAGVTKAILNMGGQIFTETHASQISSSGAKANGFEIKAQHIVVATNSPVNDRVTMHTKQHAYRTYVIGGKIKKGILPYALWWDTGNADSRWIAEPYHYVRLQPFDEMHDLLISGGEDHKTGQADTENIPEENRYARLESWTREYFPAIEEIIYKWSGQVMEPVDSLGFLGKNPGDDNMYIITGDSGNGMTHTTIGAMIIRDLITGTKNKWTELYDPSRVTFKTAGDFLREAGNMAMQYLDWFSLSGLKNVKSLKPGEGGIINSGLKKLAVYRDSENSIQTFSAVCPHLGGIVRWNADEKTFDCPCHGSRFACDGTAINGPAIVGLSKIDNNPQ